MSAVLTAKTMWALVNRWYNAVIDLVSVSLVEGDLPARSLGSALEWAGLHREELLQMWETQQFSLLPPL